MSTGPQVSASPPPIPDPVKRTGRPHPFLRWHRRILGFCFAIFALELGIFLLAFPWLGSWDLNWVPLHAPLLRDIWMNPYFRGALSGRGLVNLYVGLSELISQLKSLFG